MIGVVWKVSRIAAKVLLGVLAVTALLVGLTWTFLQTRRGGEMVRRFALPRVNDAIAGQIALGRFAFGGDRLTLENLVIYDPEARPVAHVARIDVVFSPLALLRRHVDVKVLNVRRPELALVQDARGLNLMRALAPRQARAPAPGAEGGAPDAGGRRGAIDVKALSVSDGVIDYRASDGTGTGGAARHVHVAELSIHGSASLSDDRVVADAAVKMRGGRIDARAAFDVQARRGHATARASLRSVALTMDGDLNGDAVAARVSVEAADLAATSHGLTRDFGLPRIAMAGNGRLDVVCGGTLAAPSLRVTARFPSLAQGGTRVQALTASAWIPDLGVPEALDVDARASTLSLGGQTLRSPVVTVHAAGRTNITAHAAIAAPQRLRVDLAGTRRPGERRALNIDALRVAYPEATWTLRHRARLSFGDEIVLSGFELGAEAQRLAAELRLGGGARNAHVTIARLDLGRLPRALVPPALGLGGTVDAELRSEGVRSPRIVVDAALADGRIRGHRNLSFDLAGQLAGGRARGRLRARALGAAAVARFDLPGQWPPRNQRAPIALDVDVTDTDLAVVAAAIAAGQGEEPPPRVKGRANVSIRLDGRVGQPRLRVAIGGKGLAFDDRQIGDLDLTVSGEGDGKVTAHVVTTAPARASIDITTPLSLRSILRQPPDAATFARTPFDIRGNVDRLPLAVLARLASRPERVAGTLSAEVAVSGTIAEPKGTVAVDVAGAATGRFPPTDARIELDFDAGAVEARARVTRKGRPLLAAETRVGAPLGGLLRPARLAAAPLRVRAVLGPLSLQRLGLPPETDREAPRQLKGKLHADLTIDGTVGAPRVVLHAQAGELALDNVAIGFAQIEATYADRKAKLDTRLTSGGGGTLRATAAVTADLGYPAVLRGFDLRRAPFDVRMEAQRFDVRGLSGVTQQIRTVGGLLTASITVRGTATDPRVAGKLEWKDGVLAVSEFGDFKEIHLALHGTEDDLVLDELAAASGAGRARITGSARHETGRGYHLSAEAKLERFPIYTEGQPLATVALAARVSGRMQLFDTRLKVDIDDARVALPDAERRKLQPLETPADVVLVDKGAPLNRAQAKKLEALLHSEPDKGARRAPSLRFKVNAPRHLWVEGKDAKLELGLSPDFRVSIGDTTEIFGQVTVHRGRVDVYGKRFDLKADSTLTFGGPPERPVLDVRAEHTNATQKVTVLVTAKGPLDKLQISVTAPNRPELSESQLYTLILTGQLQFGGGTSGASPSTQAASLVGGFLVSKLQATLAHRLPFDVFTIDTGGEGVRGTRLEAGRYLTDRFYVGYIGRVGSDPTRYQNRNAVHLEYQITARWEIEAEYGDLGTGTADLMWKKNY